MKLPVTADIRVDQGYPFNYSIYITDRSGKPYDLSSSSAKIEIRRNWYDPDVELTFDSSATGDPSMPSIDLSTPGWIKLFIPKSLVDSQTWDTARYCLDVTTPDNIERPVCKGTIRIVKRFLP